MLATESDNHAVREAACACIAELAAKIHPQAIRPYVERLLNTLLVCFQDDSWPVRDGKYDTCVKLFSSFSLLYIVIWYADEEVGRISSLIQYLRG
jgi:hypothetical protein